MPAHGPKFCTDTYTHAEKHPAPFPRPGSLSHEQVTTFFLNFLVYLSRVGLCTCQNYVEAKYKDFFSFPLLTLKIEYQTCSFAVDFFFST